MVDYLSIHSPNLMLLLAVLVQEFLHLQSSNYQYVRQEADNVWYKSIIRQYPPSVQVQEHCMRMAGVIQTQGPSVKSVAGFTLKWQQ